MSQIILLLPLVFIICVTLIFAPADKVTAQSETDNRNVVQVRIQSSMIFSGSLPTDELLDLTEKLQAVEYVRHIDSTINSRQRGNIDENRLQINANLEFPDFDEYKSWLTNPETESMINSIFENSEQFSMNLRIDNRE